MAVGACHERDLVPGQRELARRRGAVARLGVGARDRVGARGRTGFETELSDDEFQSRGCGDSVLDDPPGAADDALLNRYGGGTGATAASRLLDGFERDAGTPGARAPALFQPSTIRDGGAVVRRDRAAGAVRGAAARSRARGPAPRSRGGRRLEASIVRARRADESARAHDAVGCACPWGVEAGRACARRRICAHFQLPGRCPLALPPGGPLPRRLLEASGGLFTLVKLQQRLLGSCSR